MDERTDQPRPDERDEQTPAPTPVADPPRDVAHRIEDLDPADGAVVLRDLSPELSADVTEYLDPKTAAGVLVEMEPALAASVIADMEPPEAAMVLEEMDPDDRVDILALVPPDVHHALLSEMHAEQAEETLRLERYPPDTAGGIMTPEVTALPEDVTVEEAIADLRRLSEQLEQMFYVYVIDQRRHLVGVLSMRDLILARPDQRLSQIMRPTVLSVPASMDQEEVAERFRKYNYMAMPVVDERNRLLGIITVDDVVDVMEEEATEDVHKLFGAGVEERLTSSWQFSFRKRIGWLAVNLGTAFLAASVVGLFESTIARLAILAAYMPVVAGMGGNASAQAMAVAIRGIARGEMDRAMLARVFWRESIVGLMSGTVVGVLAAGVAWTLHLQHGMMLGVVVAVALVVNHTLACVWGVAIPFVMKSLGFDPAQSATIFTTTLTDMVGFFTLLGLARLVLQ